MIFQKDDLEFSCEKGVVGVRRLGSPYKSFLFGPNFKAPVSPFNCCGLCAIGGFGFGTVNIPPEVMDEWFKQLVEGKPKAIPEYVAALADYQFKKGTLLEVIGLLRFKVGTPKINNVHGPSKLQLFRINIWTWHDAWFKSVRRRYVTWYNKQEK